MALPETVRVKLSSENVGSIAITPVVVQEMPLREIVEMMLAVAGKDAARVCELLKRGGLVHGSSRFRWESIEADESSLAELLSQYPDSDPSRVWNPAACHQVILRGPTLGVVVPREAAEKRRLLRRRSFWDVILSAAAQPVYVEYSYRERADRFSATLSAQQSSSMAAESGLLAYPTLAAQVRGAMIESIDLFTRR